MIDCCFCSVICVYLVARSAAPVAAMEFSIFSGWISLMIGFFSTVWLIAFWIGTTYTGEAGIIWLGKGKHFGLKDGRSGILVLIGSNFTRYGLASLAYIFSKKLISLISGWEINTNCRVLWLKLIFIWNCLQSFAFFSY